MKHLSLFLFVLAVSCSGNSKDDKPDQNESQDAAVQDEGSKLPGGTKLPDPDPKDPGKPGDDPVTPEIPTNQFKVNASSTAAVVYFKIDNGALVKTTSDQSWAFSVKRTAFQTNSGTSGTLNFGVADTGATDYSGVTSCMGTFTLDTMLPASGAPGSQPYSGNSILNAWYNYDSVTHAVTSKKLVYLVSDGTSCFKFQILDYASGIYQVLADAMAVPAPQTPVTPAEPQLPEAEVIPAPPAVFDQTLDASSATVSTYWQLAGGKLVAAAVTDSWLIAIKRTQFQTNSGTSGGGSFGVYATGVTDFAALSSCSGLTYTYDAMLPASGAPGSLPYSGSAVLNAWYDYDFNTHVVSSKQMVYAISDGNTCMKFQLLTYASGVYTVKVSQLQGD